MMQGGSFSIGVAKVLLFLVFFLLIFGPLLLSLHIFYQKNINI